MININFPYDVGAFVKVKSKDDIIICNVISYRVYGENNYTIWVSGYNDNFFGCEVEPERVELMTEDEIEKLMSEPERW